MMSGCLAGIISVASGLDVYFGSTVIAVSMLAGIIRLCFSLPRRVVDSFSL